MDAKLNLILRAMALQMAGTYLEMCLKWGSIPPVEDFGDQLKPLLKEMEEEAEKGKFTLPSEGEMVRLLDPKFMPPLPTKEPISPPQVHRGWPKGKPRK